MAASVHPSESVLETSVKPGLSMAGLQTDPPHRFEAEAIALRSSRPIDTPAPVEAAFEQAIRAALDRLGGELIFDVLLDNVDDCRRVAAVRIDGGGDPQFALVILPKDDGPIRIEPVSDSANPLARIAESYDGLLSAFKAAA